MVLNKSMIVRMSEAENKRNGATDLMVLKAACFYDPLPSKEYLTL